MEIYELSFLRFQCVATLLLLQLMWCAGTSWRMAFIGVVGCLPSTTETKMRHLFSSGWGGAIRSYGYPYPIGSMYGIYGNMDPINIPPMLAYIPYMDPMGMIHYCSRFHHIPY